MGETNTFPEDRAAHAPRDLTRRGFVVAASAGAAAAALGLSACGSGHSSSPKATRPTDFSTGPGGGTPVRGGTLRVGTVTGGAAETLNLMTAAQNADIIRIYNLYDPLFFPAPAGGYKPALVERAEANADATAWTLHLRRGVVWHDGKPFTADDVVYTIKSSWGSPKNTYNAVLSSIVDFAGVRKLDAQTVRVPLKIGLADFPTVTCIQQCYVVQDGTKDFNKVVGTGPFKLESFDPGSRSVFTANKDYWIEGQPYVDRLVVDSSFATDSTRLNALLGGDLDIAPGVSPALATANARGGRLVLGNQPGPGFVGPVCRVDKAPFSDSRVREALKLIPDRPQYVSSVYNGFGVVSNDCPGFTDRYHAKDLKRERDVEKAKSLLKAAGHEGLQVTLATSTAFPGQSETATLFKQHARAAGVAVNVKQISPSTYYTPSGGFFTRPFSVTFYNNGLNSLAAFYLTSLVPGAPYNESHSGKDAGQTRLLFDALGETDPAKAADKWHAVQELQFNQGPYTIPATGNWLDAYSPKVRGVRTTSVLSCDNFNFTSGWLTQS